MQELQSELADATAQLDAARCAFNARQPHACASLAQLIMNFGEF